MPHPDESFPFSLPQTPGGWEELLLHVFGPRLTTREHQVLAHRIVGYSSTQIGQKLYIVTGTVKQHDEAILAKFDLTSVRQLPLYTFSWLWRRYRRK